MFTKKSISRLFSVWFILAFLLALAGPARTVSASRTEATKGSGAFDLHAVPLRSGTPPVSAISAGYYHMCELRSDGTIQCWGNNASHQTEVPSPNSGWVQVSAGGNHTCARKGSDTSIQCWGRNNEGQAPATKPGTDWMNVSTGAAHTCAVESDDTLYCWGFNNSGQAPVSVGSDGNWEQEKFSAGGWHTCGIKVDGTLQCWGNNTYGQRDNVPAPNSNWVQVSAGEYNTCAIKSGGAVYCWGAGTTNTGIDPHFGQSIPPAGNFTQISAGGYHTCGLKSDNTIECWGRNDSGQTTVPAPNENWQQVSAGNLYTCGLKTDGTLRCWGYNSYGLAPQITITPSPLPAGAQGMAYTQNLTGGGGASPYTFSIVSGALPAGLTLNSNGTWSGAPTVAGLFAFTVQANDMNDVAGQQAYTLTVDDTPPTVVSITRANSNPTGATSVNYYVTFSEIVTHVDPSDFSVTTSGVSGATVAWVVGSLTDYTVKVNTGSGSGTLRLDVTDNNSIVDGAGNPLGGPGVGDGNFTSGQAYDIEKTPPTIVSILRTNPNPTNADTVQFTVTFSEPVKYVYSSNFSVTTTGVSGASVGWVSASVDPYTVTVLTGSGNGTIRLDVPASATIQDLAGNLLANLPYTSSDIYTVNKSNWIYLPLIIR